MDKIKDIKIGPEDDAWIEWVDFDGRDSEVFDIDLFILERKMFWDKLETECVKECCGFDAYSFYPEAINRAKLGEDNFDLYIDKCVEQIKSIENEILISGYMNQLIHKTTFLKLLEHIARTK